MIGDVVDKHRVAHQTAGQLEPRFSVLTKLLNHLSLSVHTNAHTFTLIPFLFLVLLTDIAYFINLE